MNAFFGVIFFCLIFMGFLYRDSISNVLLPNVDTDNREAINLRHTKNDINSIPVKILSSSCNDGNYDDCISLSSIYIDNGEDILSLGTDVLIMPCNNSHREACKILSRIYGNNIKDESSKQSYLIYSNKACNLGDADSCYNLGYQYYKGDNKYVSMDHLKALILFNKACEGKKLEACYYMAVMYSNGGFGISKNTKLAQNIFNKSCKAGYIPSCNKLSKFKLKDTSVK